MFDVLVDIPATDPTALLGLAEYICQPRPVCAIQISQG